MLRAAGIPFEIVPGHHRRDRGAGLRGHPGHAPRAGQRRRVRHRPRGPGKPETALDWPALARLPGHARVLHGRARAAADRRAAGRRRARRRTSRSRSSSAARCPASGRWWPRSADVAERAAGHPRAGDHARRAGRGAARADRLARDAARCTGAPWRSPAPARRPARSPSACAGSAPRSSRRRRSAPGRSTSTLPDLRGYDLLCVTSPTGAERLFDHLRDARDLAGVTVAAIGPGTAARCARTAIEPDIVPERAVAEGLVEALADVPVRRVLIARARRGPRRAAGRAARARRRGGRRRALRDRRRAARRRTPARPRPPPTTCSSRPPRRCASSPPPAASLRGPRLVSIGPATSAELRAHGVEPDLEADPHTPDGLVAALLADAAP